MTRKRFFITGTDTEVGKTFVSCALLRDAQKRGLTTAAIKPVAAGCELQDSMLKNDDAVQLQEVMTESLFYEQINPVALKQAIAPHLAAAMESRKISVDRLNGFCQAAFMQGADFTLVEGAGGWRVPINNTETLADLARVLKIPVILVVKMQLGCLNHALLSVEAILADGLSLAGWVANYCDQMEFGQENIDTLKRWIPAPCLAAIPLCSASEPNIPFNSVLFIND